MGNRRLPRSKTPAKLFVKSGKGRVSALLEGSFSECAWVLTSIWPPQSGGEIWIDSVKGRFDGAAVAAAFAPDRFQRAN